MATMNMQMMAVDYVMNYALKHFEMVYDSLVNFDYEMFEQLCAAWMANAKSLMRQIWNCMSVETMWCSWLVTIGACYMLSHLGLRGSSSSSRLRKRQCGARRHQAKMKLKALLFASWAYHSQAMEGGEQAFLQRMSTLAEAATSAASAAEKALTLMASSSTGGASSSTGETLQAGLSAASRVLKNPDCFTGDDPHSFAAWKFGFCSWLSFGDPRYQRGLEAVEKLKTSEDIKPYTLKSRNFPSSSTRSSPPTSEDVAWDWCEVSQRAKMDSDCGERW